MMFDVAAMKAQYGLVTLHCTAHCTCAQTEGRIGEGWLLSRGPAVHDSVVNR